MWDWAIKWNALSFFSLALMPGCIQNHEKYEKNIAENNLCRRHADYLDRVGAEQPLEADGA